MSNLKIKDKIIKLGNRYGLSSPAMLLLNSMMDKSDSAFPKYGDLNGYKALEPHFVNLFPGGLDEYYSAFRELLDSKFVDHDISEDSVFIRPYVSPWFYSILGAIEGRKRQCTKSLVTARKEHDAYIKKYGPRMEFYQELPDELIRYNTKTNGVKIPESFMPYFSGEPLTEKNGKSVLSFDKNYVKIEKDRRNLTKEEKRVYYACMKFADTNGIIDEYNEKSLINSVIIEFGDGSVCQSTVYLAITKLLELGLVRVDINSKTCCLVVVGYKEAFERKDRYVIIPDVVLEKAFKKCQTSTIKAFFKLMFMLNNGDGGKNEKDSGQNKSVRLPFSKYLPGNNKQKKTEDGEDWLKKRYPGEVCSIVWGDIDEVDINSLAYFFHITTDDKDGDLTYYFRIRSKFYISKNVDLFKTSLALTGKNKKRAQIIEDSFDKNGIDYSQEDLRELVKIFRSAGSKNIRSVIGRLADRIQLGKERGWKDVRSIPGFIYTILHDIKNEPDPPDDYLVPEPS